MRHLWLAIGLMLAAVFLSGLLNAARAQTAGPLTDKPTLKKMISEVLEENPQLLLEALESLRKKVEAGQAPGATDTLGALRNELERDPGTYIAGNPQGDITIVEFFDYRCGFCKRAAPIVRQLLKQDGNIRVALKEFPILGPDSVIAARAAIAAMEQDKYAPFHDALMASQGPLGEERVLRIATDAGLDAAKLRQAMNDPKIEKIISRNREIAESLGISGTPSFIIGDTLAPGYVELEELQKLVAAARSSCRTC